MGTIQKKISVLLFTLCVTALSAQVVIPSEVNLVDGTLSPWSDLKPGDTLLLAAGQREHITFRNFIGTESEPFVLTNEGDVQVVSSIGYAISFQNLHHFKFEADQLGGIDIQAPNGVAIGIGEGSDNYTLDRIAMHNTSGPGILAKSDPECSGAYTRDSFFQEYAAIRDCWIYDTGTEGIYFGSTFYHGQMKNCGGTEVLLFPHLIGQVEIRNNRIERTGWDGIQVASTLNAIVEDNLIYFDSQAKVNYQMSGILFGNGTSGIISRNLVMDGEGMGIMCFGNGNQQVVNNCIVNAGKSAHFGGGVALYFDDKGQDVAGGNFFAHNTIVNPSKAFFRYFKQYPEFMPDTVLNNGFFGDAGDGIAIQDEPLEVNQGNVFSPEDNVLFVVADQPQFLRPDIIAQQGESIAELGLVSSDYYGKQRPVQQPDAGAFQMIGSGIEEYEGSLKLRDNKAWIELPHSDGAELMIVSTTGQTIYQKAVSHGDRIQLSGLNIAVEGCWVSLRRHGIPIQTRYFIPR